MKLPSVLLVAALTVSVAGCGEGGPETVTTADCASQIRADGVVYTSDGYSGLEAREHATAERAECHDVGPDAKGSVFPDVPDRVATWAFEGHPTDEVLGVRI